MSCRDWKKRIPHYLAGELPGDECAAFEEHLAKCRHCRDELDSFREIDSLIDAVDIDIPEIDLTGNIMKQVSYGRGYSGNRGKRTVAILQDLVTAAAAALILFWFSGPALSDGKFPVDTKRVIEVSDTVGGAFQSYVDFSVATTNRLSDSMKQIGPGDEGR